MADPVTGRYLERDPIGLAGGINPYAYVGGRPTHYVDPLGTISVTWAGAGAGLGEGASIGKILLGGPGAPLAIGLQPNHTAGPELSEHPGDRSDAAPADDGEDDSADAPDDSGDDSADNGDGGDGDKNCPSEGQKQCKPKKDKKKKKDTDAKKLSEGEIKKLQDEGFDPHDLKPKKNGSRYDLFKDNDGNIIVKPKDGSGPGEPTGLNIKHF